MVSGFVCAARAAFSEMSDKQLENQTKRCVAATTDAPRGSAARAIPVAVLAHSKAAREGATGTSPAGVWVLVRRRRLRLSNAQQPAPARPARGAHKHSEGNFSSCAQLHRARQCSVAHVRILQYTNRFRSCIARRDLHAAHCQPNIPVQCRVHGAASMAWRAARRRAGTL